MAALAPALRHLAMEGRALLTRLASVRPFALQMTAVPAACISPAAQTAIDTHLERARHRLRETALEFLDLLHSEAGRTMSPEVAQRRFTIVRLRFNALLAQLDIFAEVLVQRSEQEYGVWISGLDAVAADALALPDYYEAPPVICYCDRSAGAAIRRARTRLPGGASSPVAVIRIPRERMIGSGIASSLIHEVGHQASSLLGLVESARRSLGDRQNQSTASERVAWAYWGRCISEILADFWSVAKVGIGSTLGLMGVVSLPRAFVFRINLDDPHPCPWIRVKLSCAMGRALYPHSQWNRLESIWESFYPSDGLDQERSRLLAILAENMPFFVEMLANHRPASLRGGSLAETVVEAERQPARLAARYESWRESPLRSRSVSPSLAFAVIGQARADEEISPEEESKLVGLLLTHWALRGTLDTTALCAEVPRVGPNLRHRDSGILSTISP
jgi:hypothetical protein